MRGEGRRAVHDQSGPSSRCPPPQAPPRERGGAGAVPEALGWPGGEGAGPRGPDAVRVGSEGSEAACVGPRPVSLPTGSVSWATPLAHREARTSGIPREDSEVPLGVGFVAKARICLLPARKCCELLALGFFLSIYKKKINKNKTSCQPWLRGACNSRRTPRALRGGLGALRPSGGGASPSP